MTARSIASHPVLWVAVVLAALTALWHALGAPVSLITQIAIYTLYGAGVNLLVGYTGLVPFGASVFFGARAMRRPSSCSGAVGNEIVALALVGAVLAAARRSSSARSSCAARVSISRC